jgi:hypothetical protein
MMSELTQEQIIEGLIAEGVDELTAQQVVNDGLITNPAEARNLILELRG